MRILLIEDEERLAEALAYLLKKNKYGVDTASDGEIGQAKAETGIYNLIILDRMLPGKDGIAILKELRAKGMKTPVLLLTAKDSIEDRVEGLDAGADDYLIKPFATEELLARVRALSRRQTELLRDEKIRLSSLTLDTLRSEVTIGAETIKLTNKEAQLLELFLRNYGQVITKEQIFDRVWGLDTDVEINNLETYIHFLRKKLNSPQCPVRIETVRGIGYCLKEDTHVQ
ncbi:MAG: response regulator transcription factor [Bacillota bacterium]|uniref:Stage 0 sporulation protein A homolog n=1 Tax=Thermanaerosceptrum fracticalcis TaxID=1712410 RepID=A0A7G6E8U7_THEFR|nr:response regulator transcription factor [Thermanaerosceptrum fracticalcis]QNB48501.1 response regulator [Thermanaerosceptrum fracticalcis]